MILNQGLKAVPNAAALHHSLGLWYIRHKDVNKAIASLKQAAELEKDDARYQYVYAVALSKENVGEAIKVLERSVKRHTGDIQALFALAHYHEQLGHNMQAEAYRKKAESLGRFIPEIPKQ